MILYDADGNEIQPTRKQVSKTMWRSLAIVALLACPVCAWIPHSRASLPKTPSPIASYNAGIYIESEGHDPVENHLGDPITPPVPKTCTVSEGGKTSTLRCFKTPAHDALNPMFAAPMEF